MHQVTQPFCWWVNQYKFKADLWNRAVLFPAAPLSAAGCWMRLCHLMEKGLRTGLDWASRLWCMSIAPANIDMETVKEQPHGSQPFLPILASSLAKYHTDVRSQNTRHQHIHITDIFTIIQLLTLCAHKPIIPVSGVSLITLVFVWEAYCLFMFIYFTREEEETISPATLR